MSSHEQPPRIYATSYKKKSDSTTRQRQQSTSSRVLSNQQITASQLQSAVGTTTHMKMKKCSATVGAAKRCLLTLQQRLAHSAAPPLTMERHWSTP